MRAKLKTRRKTLASALIVLFIVSMIPILLYARADTSGEKREGAVRFDVEDPQGVSGSGVDAGDVEYWALVIGVSEYMYATDLDYCDDDAIDISSALVTYQGWDPRHIFLLLDSEATAENVGDHLSMLSTLVDSNDVFLLTFSGHGTWYPDDDGDEADGYDEAIVFHDYAILDDTLETALGWFNPTAKIMVFLDSCFSGGFIKDTSGLREEDLVSRSLPGTKQVELEDSFSRDLDKAGYVVLTACDVWELSYESSELENGVFTYYFVEGIGSGFPADTNMNGYISAEEGFNYASPRTSEYMAYYGYEQNPQLYDGVPGELEISVYNEARVDLTVTVKAPPPKATVDLTVTVKAPPPKATVDLTVTVKAPPPKATVDLTVTVSTPS